MNSPLARLRYHVTGAITRGEAEAIVEKPTTETIGSEGTEYLVTIPAGKKRRYNAIVKAANDEGTIQAGDARELFSRPENHTTMSLARALRLAGFELQAQ